MSNIDVKAAVQKIRDLAAARPDFVYLDESGIAGGKCKYWHLFENEPGCLVGQALYALGVSGERLEFFDNYEDGVNGAQAVEDCSDVMPGTLPVSVGMWIDEVQRCQDSGKTWGASVTVADEKWYFDPDILD